ncbi:hypothetical protein NLI96_g9854 [Meripilus lineatus]|uniref:RRM domain-containing protein n=1 Tax=Meripilus lineatus TaxID=2056292 RepID=A0AAD5YAL6_9APHY|nr:hypothetical protein NLI96_g9854 [Physisporinus lineatus]
MMKRLASRETGKNRGGFVPVFRDPLFSRYVKVSGLSQTALPSDLRRLCVKNNVESIASTAIIYKRFSTTGEGLITLSDPNTAERSLKALERGMVGGLVVSSRCIPAPADATPARSRGQKGKLEAAKRGLIQGDGPNGGIADRGNAVLISGLPGKMTGDALRTYFKTFRFESQEGVKAITKLELPEGIVSLYSRHLVRMASQAEAHRLVRRFHMTFYQSEVWGTRYLMKAHVVY